MDEVTDGACESLDACMTRVDKFSAKQCYLREFSTAVFKVPLKLLYFPMSVLLGLLEGKESYNFLKWHIRPTQKALILFVRRLTTSSIDETKIQPRIYAVVPPVAERRAPLVYDFCASARSTYRGASSAGCAGRRRGRVATNWFSCSVVIPSPARIGV